MQRKSFFVFIIGIVLFILACSAAQGAPALPTKSFGVTPYGAKPTRPQPTRTFTPVADISTPAVFPRWVADFSDPILYALQSQRPAYQDNFPPICIDEDKNWKICSTPEQRLNYQYPLSSLVTSIPRPTLDLQPDLQTGYALLNTGWFFIVPESQKNPHYAHIDSGALVLNLPEGNEQKDMRVYNPHLMARNFVLQFDIEFGETQPEDAFRFQLEQGGERFALDLTKDKRWQFQWGAAQPHAGGYEYFAVSQVRVLIIARERQCAVYLNNVPLDYVEICRVDPSQKITPQSVTFHLLGKPGYASMLRIDNVALWDLDKIPDLP